MFNFVICDRNARRNAFRSSKKSCPTPSSDYNPHRNASTNFIKNTAYQIQSRSTLDSNMQSPDIRGGADNSLARPTSRCRRTVSTVSLERGVCSCAECPFLLQRLKGSMSSDARDFNNIETRAVIRFFFLQGKAPKEIHALLIETLGEHAPLYATVKNLVARFKRDDFFT